MTVFLFLALVAAVLGVAQFASQLATAIAWGITGILCGLVLRTRLTGGVQRVLVVWFFAVGFTIAGNWTTLMLMSQVELIKLVVVYFGVWALFGLAATTPYLGRGWRLLLPVIAAACFGASQALALVLVFEFGPIAMLLHPALACLGAGAFDQLCQSIGLVSPEEDFDRLRVRFEFRLR